MRVQPIEKPKSINSLDGLWRRMRQATENYRLFHKKDAMITEVMSAARAEAYDAMVKKNSQEKQRLLKTNKETEKDWRETEIISKWWFSGVVEASGRGGRISFLFLFFYLKCHE